MHVFCIASAIVKPVVEYTVPPQSINQSIKFLCGLSSGIIARSTGDSQLMSSMQSGKDFLNNSDVLRRRRNVVNDSADVRSSGRSFHVCRPATGKARLPTVDSLLLLFGVSRKPIFGSYLVSKNTDLNITK